MKFPLFLGFTLLFSSFLLDASDWPEFRGEGRRGIWNEENVISSFPESGELTPVWTAEVGAGYSGPTVTDDHVFVLDRGKPGEESKNQERVLCFERKNGQPHWDVTYDAPYSDIGYAYGPRGSVTVSDGKAFAMGVMGHIHCIDVESGKVVWKKDLGSDYRIDMPIWGLTCSPLVEGDMVIVQAGAMEDKACIIAFHRETGEEAWRAFSDKASYVSPIMIEQAGKRVLVAWTGERIAGMDPETGVVHWEIPTPPNKMPINVPGPALNEDSTLMFLSVFYDGSRLIELDQNKLAAREFWHRQGINERKTDALHCMISPPYMKDGYIYGIDSYGQMRCLDPKTGDRIWEDETAVPPGRWGTAFMVLNGEKTWMLNERGELIIAELTPEGYREIDRAKMIEPTTPLKQRPEGTVLWSHPAFAGTQVFARNDKELICVDLKK